MYFFFQYSNNITRDGAKQLALLLKANTPLEVLNLAYNRIEDDGAVALAEAVAAYNTNLTTWVSLNFMSRAGDPDAVLWWQCNSFWQAFEHLRSFPRPWFSCSGLA